MTVEQLAALIPSAKRDAALLILQAFSFVEEKPDFKYDEELFADPKYYPENATRLKEN